MKTFSKVMCVIFAISFFGHLTAGNFFPFGLAGALVFGYLGWKPTEDEEEISEAS